MTPPNIRINWDEVRLQFEQLDTLRRLNNLFKTLDAKCYDREDTTTLDKIYEITRRRITASTDKTQELKA